MLIKCVFSSKGCTLTLSLSGFPFCIQFLTNFSSFKLPHNNRTEVGRFLWKSPVQPPFQSKFNCIKLLRDVSSEVLKISTFGDPTVWAPVSIFDQDLMVTFFPYLIRISHIKNSLSLCIGTSSSFPISRNPDP